MKLLVYAIARSAPRGKLGVGVQREALAVRAHGGLVSIVGKVASSPRITEESLYAHDRIVRRIAARTSAALPMRFGSTVVDESALERFVEERRGEFVQALSKVRGCEQFTLRVFVDASRALERPTLCTDGPGARYLRARAESHFPPEIAQLRALLAPLVKDERAEAHDVPPLVASVYPLVPRASRAAYRALYARGVQELASARVALSGPWPTYAFAESA